MKHLTLVRHGLTEWSVDRRLNGWTDLPLTEKGRDQARALHDRLANEHFEGVWSSDLMRAVETARLARGESVRDRRLRELDFGSLEGSTWDELPDEIQTGLMSFEGFAAPGGETVDGLATRVDDFLGELAAGRHLVFTHGGVIRLLLRRAGSFDPVPHGEVIDLRLPGSAGAGGGRLRNG